MTTTRHHEHSDKILTVFVSSTNDMHKYREIVRQEVSRLGMWPDMYETWNENDIPPQEVCIRHISKSDIFVLLLGTCHDYQICDLSQSMINFEYETAVSARIPVFVLMEHKSMETNGVAPRPFIDKVFSRHIVNPFSDEDELRMLLQRRMGYGMRYSQL